MEESAQPPAAPPPVPPSGFQSPKARKKFFIAAGLAGAVVVALQVLLRLWLSSRFPATAGEPQWAVRLQNVHAESVAVWRGDLWYVAGEISGGMESPENRENNRLVHLTEQGPATVFTLASGPAWLLAHGDTLWIFASDGLSQYDGKTAQQVPAKKLPDSASQPFLLDGAPAAVEVEAGAYSVVALENGQWTAKAQLFLGDAKDAPAAARLKVLVIGGQPYVFCPQGDTLYCHKGFPGKEVRFPAGWETVGPLGDLWAVAANGDVPEAFTVRMEKDKLAEGIIGFAREAAGSSGPRAAGLPALRVAGWKPAFSRSSPLPLRALGAATDAAGGCRVVYQALQWTLNVVQLAGGKTSARRYGDIMPADRARALLVMLSWIVSGALSVALAVVLSRIVKVYRTENFSGPGGPLPCASLTRRALALLLDAPMVLGPLAAGLIVLVCVLPGIEDRVDSSAVNDLPYLLIGGALWAVAAFFIFCYTLGRWGRTPGKWAMGIRVLGADLAPCGFGRALLRSLLLLVDGFLNFSFGALLIACTANRQRIGDMAARTIVVRETAPSAQSGHNLA